MPSVVITGAGRGIGRTLTEHFSQLGWTVYATARSPQQLDELATIPGVDPIDLDVADTDAVAALGRRLPGELDGVVNNAGIFVNGPLEAIAVDDLSRQLAVNVVAPLAVTQATLPALRRGRGRVAFISSTSGLYTTPGTGAYNASKYALEAMGDAFRMELRPWRIPVALIEPGPISTGVWGDVEADHDRMVARFSPEHRALYAGHLAGTRKLLKTVQKQTADPVTVARAVEHALTSRRPKARYLLDASSRAQKVFMNSAPTAITDALLAKLTTAPTGR